MVTLTDEYPYNMFPHEEAAERIIESIRCRCKHRPYQHSPNGIDSGYGRCCALKCKCHDYWPHYSQPKFANIIWRTMENHGYIMPRFTARLIEPRNFYWEETKDGLEVWEIDPQRFYWEEDCHGLTDGFFRRLCNG